MVLTSREKPAVVAMLQGETMPVRVLNLAGLPQADGARLLQAKGLVGPVQQVFSLVQSYQGNPLALMITATSIQDLCGGKIDAFLQQQTIVFNGVRNLLQQQIHRLSELETKIMYWLAINREPVPVQELQADLVPFVPMSRLLEALESLYWRSLIEKNEDGFTQQPIIMEYMTEQLIEGICQDILAISVNSDTGFWSETELRHPLTFLKNYALLKATARDYIRESQTRLILELVAQQISIHFSPQELLGRANALLAHLRHTSASNYAAGNLINLLGHLRIDLTGTDFSRLKIWQADLSNLNLHRVNFAQADLTKSIFAETFGGILATAFSPDGTLLATSDSNGGIQVWQVSTGQQLLALAEGRAPWVWSVTFNPTQPNLLASCSDDTYIKLWDVQTGECLQVLSGHASSVHMVAFSPDGQLLASGSEDGTIRLWQVSDCRSASCIATLEGAHGDDEHHRGQRDPQRALEAVPAVQHAEDRPEHARVDVDGQQGAHRHHTRHRSFEEREALDHEVRQRHEHQRGRGDPQHAAREAARETRVAVDGEPERQHQKEQQQSSRDGPFAFLHRSGLHLEVGRRLGLAREDDAARLLLGRQRVLDGHCHRSLPEPDLALTAGSRSARVVDRHTHVLGGLEHARARRQRRRSAGDGECHHGRRWRRFDHRGLDRRLPVALAARRAEGLGADLLAGDAELQQHRARGVHHGRRATEVDPSTRDVRHPLSDELLGHAALRAHPCGAVGAGHGRDDVQIRVPLLQVFEFFPEHEVRRGAAGEQQEDVLVPTPVRERSHHAHQGSDAHAAADQHDPVRLGSREREASLRRGDLLQVARRDAVVQVPRHHTLLLAFDRDLHVSSLLGGRRDRVRTLGGAARLGHSERQELPWEELEGHWPARRVDEPEGLDPRRLVVIGDRLSELATTPVGEVELKRCQRLLCNDYAFSTETASQLAGLYGYYSVIAQPELAVAYPQVISSFQPEELQQLADQYLSPLRYAAVVLQPA
ncbi:pentapeptide repeat-containing protein [Leptolyngbya sp. 7M]|nr:pentapeptide repeat-containing protein [Leptolyngbya sp. 7M]QYO64203.1 pentapeptide repeat-containing protein [Leptolyngbya sp. 7M]